MAARKSPAAGAKPDKLWRDALMRAVRRRTGDSKDDPQYLEKIADRCVSEANKGNMAAIKEIGDRLDGKAAQSVALTGDPDSAVTFNLRLADGLKPK